MAKLLKLRRGTTTQHGSFTGAEGEVTIDTTKDTAVVHDGSTQGGTPLAKEDMSNVSSASIAGRLGADSIATTKIAGGALPTDVTVASANIVNGTIVNADIASNAAIAGTKLENSGVTAGTYGSSTAIPIVTVDAQGLVTGASTTAVDSTKIQNGTTEVATANNGNITMTQGGNTRLTVDSAGVDITGELNVNGNVAFTNELNLMGTENNKYLDINLGANTFNIRGTSSGDTNHVTMMTIQRNGATTVRHAGATKLATQSGGVAVTGNISVTGNVDGRDVAADGTLLDGLTSSTGVIKNGVTATTQAASDSSTKVATTSYVKSAITNYNFPSGTKMLFQQTSAPTGWTKVTSNVNNRALRVVSGTAGSGGSNAFTTAFGSRGINANAGNTTAGGNVSSSAGNTTAGGNVSVANATQGGNISVGNTTAGGNLSIANASTGGNVNSHTLSINEIPSHSHNVNPFNASGPNNRGNVGGGISNANRRGPGLSFTQPSTTGNAGGGGGHSHGFTGGSHNHNGTLSGTAHNHNASFSGSAHSHNASFSGSAHNHNVNSSFSGTAHNHSISVGNLDMAVSYLDVIIAEKD